MTCANWLLTVCSAAILVVTLWTGLVSATAVKWIVVVAAALVLISAWTIVECKPCKAKKKK